MTNSSCRHIIQGQTVFVYTRQTVFVYTIQTVFVYIQDIRQTVFVLYYTRTNSKDK